MTLIKMFFFNFVLFCGQSGWRSVLHSAWMNLLGRTREAIWPIEPAADVTSTPVMDLLSAFTSLWGALDVHCPLYGDCSHSYPAP